MDGNINAFNVKASTECWGIRVRDGCGVPSSTLATPANSACAAALAWLHAILHLIANLWPLLLLSMMLTLIFAWPSILKPLLLVVACGTHVVDACPAVVTSETPP